MNKSGKTDDAPMVMPWLFSKSFRRQHPEKVQDIKTRLTKQYLTRNSTAFERQVRANIGHDTRGQLHRIQIPTLIMTGKDDELTPPGMTRELHSEIPNSKLLIFDQGGHGLYWEVPRLFNKAVLEFIS
ncbi:MAG TPA: alpha/beta fold hydrolase [Deltaproteobacteria bacterium]|nr:alpha/beta fold hydrolase [Deltaproteobacteria bacterium]